MSGGAAKSPLLRFNEEEWFRRLGQLAKSIGTDHFHRELIDVFGAGIRHEASWIIRYSRVAPPDVLYTRNVSDETVRIYNTQCSEIDPFSQHWKNRGSAGVLTLSQLNSSSIESVIYSKIFLPAANVSDEMGMFFPTVGHCCFGLFLERERGHFSKADVQRAELIFPALEGYHRAHLERLFNDLRYPNATEVKGFIKRPTIIQDRFGVEVYSNELVESSGRLGCVHHVKGSDHLYRLNSQNMRLKKLCSKGRGARQGFFAGAGGKNVRSRTAAFHAR